jgi:hypothetical protein
MDLSSTEIFPQIIVSLIIITVVFISFMVLETMYKAYLGYGKARIAVYPYTGSKTKEFKQSPKNPAATNLPVSENQLTGIEFSYSTFLYISDKTDDNTEGWKTVFYKGYNSSLYPLQGPGVFVSSSSNATAAPTLRVVMNTYDNWFNPIDVKQIPFNKWFHLCLVLRNNTLEIYVNGNLANKKTFSGTLPYQNYGSLNLFPELKTLPSQFKNDATNTINKMGIPPGENFTINGAASGYISNLYYFSYAMSYSEIQSMLTMGPSSEFDMGDMDRPPYLIDSWWSQRKDK